MILEHEQRLKALAGFLARKSRRGMVDYYELLDALTAMYDLGAGLGPVPVLPDGMTGTMADFERHIVLTTLKACGGDVLEVTALLDIGKTTLYRKLREWGIPTNRAPRFASKEQPSDNSASIASAGIAGTASNVDAG